MKKVSVIAQTSDKTDMLRGLRKLGIMHIYTEQQRSVKAEAIMKEGDSLVAVLNTIKEANPDLKKNPVRQEKLDDKDFLDMHHSLLGAMDEVRTLREENIKDQFLYDSIKDWGNFNPEEIRSLERDGVKLHFYLIDQKEIANIPEDVRFVMLDNVNRTPAVATMNCTLPYEVHAKEFEIPEMGAQELLETIKANTERMAYLQGRIKDSARYIDMYERSILLNGSSFDLEQISSQMDDEGQLCWVTGYIPSKKIDKFEKFAKKNSYGYMYDDPDEEDLPPTEVTYKGCSKIIRPIFDMLGIVPGYREYDISLYFLLFFILFFAMIIGDAGYGFVFLAVAVGMHIKAKKANNTNLLLYVLSIGTIVWGSLTGTWFGSQAIVENTFLRYLVIPNLANYPTIFGVDPKVAQDTMMQFSFTIGVIQLVVACIYTIVQKIRQKDPSWISNLGWATSLVALYFVVLNLVFGIPVAYPVVFSAVGVGFVLVVVFGCQEKGQSFVKGIKAGFAGIFTTFLDTISCFSNIMSYIRLFAVGLASLAIAQSFNDMGMSMWGGFASIASVLVLILGHVLNLVMGLLSVVVHGVRLNVLEFSGQLGMSWSGIAYEPFKEAVENENNSNQ